MGDKYIFSKLQRPAMVFMRRATRLPMSTSSESTVIASSMAPATKTRDQIREALDKVEDKRIQQGITDVLTGQRAVKMAQYREWYLKTFVEGDRQHKSSNSENTDNTANALLAIDR